MKTLPRRAAKPPLPDQPQTTSPVELTPESGSGVAGTAVFGFADSRLFVDLDLDGLDPDLSRKSAYVLWLMFNDTGGYPVSVLAPNQNGRVLDRLEVPAPIRDTVVGLARSVRISQSSVKRLRDDSIQAADTGVPLVPFSGEGLAIGRIPLVEGGRGTGGGAAGGGDGGAGRGQSGGAGTTSPPARTPSSQPGRLTPGWGPSQSGSSLPGFMIPTGSSRSLTAPSAAIPNSPTSAVMYPA